jgi:hypothetical protein
LATKVLPSAGAVSYPGSGNIALQYHSNTQTTGQATEYTFSGYFAPFGPLNYKPYIIITATTNPGDDTYCLAFFDATTGTVAGKTIQSGWSEVLAITAVIAPCGMWYVTWTVRFTQPALLRTKISQYFQIADATTQTVYTADGLSGVQRACHQFEIGSYATSYIPTTTAAVTRNADTSTSAATTRNADVDSMTGANFSSWYRQDEGTFVVESLITGDISSTSYPRVFEVSDGTASNSILNGSSNNLGLYEVNAGGVTQLGLYPAESENITKKVAFAVKANDFAYSLNGGAVTTDSSGLVPTVDRLRIGASGVSSNSLNGTISKLQYYPQRLTNAQLVALSTQ